MLKVDAKTIVSAYCECGWFGSNYNMNIYRGCCHGCIYCDSRSQCYQIKDFDTVRAKKDALRIIETDLSKKRKKGILITGSMSDPYNPFEENELLTRGALKLADRYGFGVVIDTKSDLAVRDAEILLSIKKHSPVLVNFTITTADDDLCAKIERNVCVSSARLKAIKSLTALGIPCGVLFMPILPHVNDTEENILGIVRLAKAAGAFHIYTGGDFGLTMREGQREYFLQKLDEIEKGLSSKYMREFGNNYICPSKNDAALNALFEAECNKLGLLFHMSDITKAVKSPYAQEQMSFL